ncbi:restriction endonuclease [Vibrio parahaemolyticus]|uniref:restriction endonuclease n=1 Tax=Vibrio parahaemolyticus TaxID=670 RepID=UPI001B7D8135|nr:restriction endonuclease [Vibrio parahaemolyticus]EIW7860118.1 restriction endonuclease [Vibrio parahaemolyticus]ELA7254577.1 restriction endonuclease [Vibrio parahaemolyticus]EMF1837794.1 restriction endonuclease [Vibrio parahaemolyticus]MEA5183678.1 restriction endonuclease [Vibrio parahaemolyticus]
MEFESKLSLLENGNLSPQDAEKELGDILESLLNEDGYNIVQTPFRGDIGVDFIAEKQFGNHQEQIGIEYKHYKSSVGVNVVRGLLGTTFTNNFGRLILVTNSRFTQGALELAKSALPVKLELIDLDALRAWVQRADKTEDYDFELVNIIRSNISDRLATLIAKNPRYLMDIEWRELEYVIQTVFEELGFSAELTPGSKDGGKDLVLTCRVSGKDHTYYVELKHWRSQQKVGGQAAKDFLKVIINEEINGGLFLSSYGYCDNAFEMLTEIDRKHLKFGDQKKIVTLCKQYVKSKSGLWAPTDGLSNVLFEQTL